MTEEQIKSEITVMACFVVAAAIVLPFYLMCLPNNPWHAGTTQHLICRIVYWGSALSWWVYVTVKMKGNHFVGNLLCGILGPITILTLLFYGVYLRKLKDNGDN